METYVTPRKAEDFIPALHEGSVNLLLTDPPYYGITDDAFVKGLISHLYRLS
jgi:hypothetical protein